MAQQIVTPEAYGGAPKRAGVLSAGERFGELTTEVVIASTKAGHLWQCRCDCGRIALRTAAALRFAAKRGMTPSCRDCGLEVRRGRSWAIRASIAERLRDLWERRRTLWSPYAEDRLEEAVRSDFAEQIAAPGTVAFDGAPMTGEPRFYHPAIFQDRRALHPLRGGTERRWLCIECQEGFRDGYGCVGCIQPVCEACVEKERHLHMHEGMTLEEVGAFFGVGRERIRQIEARALRKLRHPCRRMRFE